MTGRRMLVVGAHSADFVWRAAGAVAAHTVAGGEALVLALSYRHRRSRTSSGSGTRRRSGPQRPSGRASRRSTWGTTRYGSGTRTSTGWPG
jgi:hypothetical protein